MIELFDTHAHLAAEQLAGDSAGVLSRARAVGVTQMLSVGTALPTSRASLALANAEAGIFAAVGLHPTNLLEIAEGDWDEIVCLAAEPKAVALGESGLDLYWKEVPLPLQQDYFDRHLRLSQELKLPLVIHQRDSAAEILVMLREARQRGPLIGIMHSFTGDTAIARECLELGLHISFAGMVTFKNAADI
ncbi:MAG: TatD family hydrolase, partial [Planctomycetes bacterium]|nr:TatD family hydrolase [Planctomycetota bacterium]